MNRQFDIVWDRAYKEVMKLNNFLAKAKIPSLIISSMLVGGLGSAYIWNGVAHGDWDPTALTNQVQANTTQLQNHETRISNLETNAGITPSPVPSPTPSSSPIVLGTATQAATPPPPTPVATPTPTFVNQTEENDNPQAQTCDLVDHYSDGSTTVQHAANTTTSRGYATTPCSNIGPQPGTASHSLH